MKNKRRKKKNQTIVIQQKNKIYTILDPTLKQVTERLHSSASYIYTCNLWKRDLFIQYSLLYKRSKKRANETFRSFQKLNCRFYYFLICVETKVLRSIQEIIVKMQNICNLIGWNSVDISDIFNCYRENMECEMQESWTGYTKHLNSH